MSANGDLVRRLREATLRVYREQPEHQVCSDLDRLRDADDPTWCREIWQGHQCDRRRNHVVEGYYNRHRCRGCGVHWP